MPSAAFKVRLAVATITLLMLPAMHPAWAQEGALPVLDPIGDVSVAPGVTLDVPIHASDPDGEPVTFATNFAPDFVTTLSTGPNDGVVRLSPAATDIGSAVITVVALDPLEGADWSTFTATITPPAGYPIAYAGGPYDHADVEFDGTRSFDPSGSPLTYLWDFGDGSTATGPRPVHTYRLCYPYDCPPGTAGSYIVTLTVTDDEGHSSRGTTYIIVTDLVVGATAFPSQNRPFLKAPAGQAAVCFQIQASPVFGGFDPRYVDLSGVKLRLRPPASSLVIDAIDSKSALVGDTNKDGLTEIKVCFRGDDLTRLFEPLYAGRSLVDLQLEGPLTLAGRFIATFRCEVRKSGGHLVAQVTPNPVRAGMGNLEFVVDRAGPARAEMFDVEGRLVRVLLDTPSLAAGRHSIGIDGLEGAARLPRGVYFYRVVVSGVEATGKVVLAR
ncbi:MAG TPA: PKD domain-containing protein [Candidatus Eisenbacteria bacterium]|nr:PKD domain-containing protein [Candidatus Eisenbacteria bacterium]